MTRSASLAPAITLPAPRAVLTLTKPITWFPPMWAFGCGLVSAGLGLRDIPLAIAGIVLAGPLLCGASQIVNDWFDRDVDRLNEPDRPIPSGRIPGRWGLWLASLWSALSLLAAAALGRWVFGAALAGVALSWAYSAPPIRLKREGWAGNAAVAISYEGLAWFSGAAVLTGGFPDAQIVALAALYSLGAVGIMALNDFKSVAGDRVMSIRTLPVRYGVERAGRIACVIMAVPQIAVGALLIAWGTPFHAAILALLLIVQIGLMRRFLKDCRGRAAWYNATGTSLYVLGMLVSALAVSASLAGLA